MSSRVEPQRHHHLAITAGHVCALVCESRTLDRLRLSHASRAPLPCCTQHSLDTIPPAPPAALLILQVVGAAQQQEETRRGARAECRDTAPGPRAGRKVKEQGEGDTACQFDQQRSSRAIHHSPRRRWYEMSYGAWVVNTDIFAEVRLSSFFALDRLVPFHREAWQQPASMDVIDALFDQSEPSDVRSIQRTNETLNEFVQGLYAGIDAHSQIQAQIDFFRAQAERYEGPPTEASILFHVSQLPHFIPPPPPVAFDPSALQPDPFTTRVMDERITEIALPSEQAERPATFREHVRRRRGGMLLISVKRQRKLKMKKHKYKKLMKRTRLLRRKLDRT
jgi:hypothetical protein